MTSTDTAANDRTRELAWSVAILCVFVLVRVALLVVREPFYDELFTQWITRRSFAGVLDALRHDSGPPLFYFVLKALGIQSVDGARIFSLVCATLSAAILLFARRLGSIRFAAVLLLAVYAPSALLSTDARAYALCGLFVTIGLAAIAYERDLLAACAFALAAYSHYYGVLFFTTLPRIRAMALSAALFIPGVLLALAQPSASMQWLATSLRENPLVNLSFAGRYPESLFRPAPWLLVAISLLLLVAAVARDWPMARFTLIPLGLVFLFELVGRPIYFPMRFESVIAVPLVLWIATSSRKWIPRVRIALLSALALIGAYVCVDGIAEHAARPLDDYRAVALAAGARLNAPTPVVASGYLYLETTSAIGDRVLSFPLEQATHPGWRAFVDEDRLRAEARVLPQQFFWIVERGAPELPVLCRERICRVAFGNARALVVNVQPRVTNAQRVSDIQSPPHH